MTDTLPTPTTLAAVKALVEALLVADPGCAALICQVAANALRDCAKPGAQAEACWEAQAAATATMRAFPLVRSAWAACILGEQGMRAVEWADAMRAQESMRTALCAALTAR